MCYRLGIHGKYRNLLNNFWNSLQCLPMGNAGVSNFRQYVQHVIFDKCLS